MSAKQTGLVWELDLPHDEAWVRMAMAGHADHEGHNVSPGVPLLAWKTGYTTRQVRRILAVLQRRGLIVVEEPGGGRRTTHYRLELSRAESDAQRAGVRPRLGGSEPGAARLCSIPCGRHSSGHGGRGFGIAGREERERS